jgi:hypothetical protein
MELIIFLTIWVVGALVTALIFRVWDNEFTTPTDSLAVTTFWPVWLISGVVVIVVFVIIGAIHGLYQLVTMKRDEPSDKDE